MFLSKSICTFKSRAPIVWMVVFEDGFSLTVISEDYHS